MDKSERLRVLGDITNHIANDTTADAGGIMRVPMSDFTCPEILGQEQDAFFRNTALCMGLSGALPKPKTYWSDNETGIPILMVRDGEGRFRAYANVCRHRGSQVAPEGRGSKECFTCPYHAWTYGVDGSLLAINKKSHFGDISRKKLSLFELPSAELHGMLWVRPTQGDAVDEAECLGGLEDDMAHWQLTDFPFAHTQVIDVRANWKMAIDTFAENYHVNVLHAETVGKEMKANLQTCDIFKNNLRFVYPNQKLDLMRLMSLNMERWPYPQIATTLYYIYPNVIMMVDGFGVDLLRFFPLENSPSRSRTVHTWYVNPKVQPQLKEFGYSYEERASQFGEVIVNEDYETIAKIQLNAERGTQPEMLLGRNEAVLQHIHNVLRFGVGRDLMPVEEI
ncbi:MAG: aromatic ring-hydroxylating dioxygenase subunit alpha [Halieaceae bacterium]|nr:aromatic ring-hydroxylating dioxygenase subunit alpha [Halieaceae bacterium]